jgi:hypothetical protein
MKVCEKTAINRYAFSFFMTLLLVGLKSAIYCIMKYFNHSRQKRFFASLCFVGYYIQREYFQVDCSRISGKWNMFEKSILKHTHTFPTIPLCVMPYGCMRVPVRTHKFLRYRRSRHPLHHTYACMPSRALRIHVFGNTRLCKALFIHVDCKPIDCLFR